MVLYFHFTHYIELQTWNPLYNFNLEIPFVFEPISWVSVIASISSVIYAYYRSFQICNVLHTPYTNTKSSKSAIYMHKKRVKTPENFLKFRKYVILNFPVLDFLIHKIKEWEFQNSSVVLPPPLPPIFINLLWQCIYICIKVYYNLNF